MKPYHRYTLIFLIVASLNLLVIALFNKFVDPYGVMNSQVKLGINKVKPEKNAHVRLFKALEITKLKPKTIVLGSSRSEFGLDPNHPALSNYQPTYNLAITGANMYEVMRYFQHAIANQPDLKEIVLGIDFFMFNSYRENKPDFKENRLETNKLSVSDTFEVLLSLNALTASVETINLNRSDPRAIGYFYPNGVRDAKYYREHVHYNKTQSLIFKKSLKKFLTEPGYYQTYQLSEARLNDLKTIISTCEQRGIKLKVLISPSHASDYEAIRVAKLELVLKQWKREVVKMTPVWDFSGYNSITSEPISDNIKNYLDSSHYRKEVGDLVLNRMFHYKEETVPADFGVLLTPDNIDSYQEKIRADREAWVKNQPDMEQLVRDLNSKESLVSIKREQRTGNGQQGNPQN